MKQIKRLSLAGISLSDAAWPKRDREFLLTGDVSFGSVRRHASTQTVRQRRLCVPRVEPSRGTRSSFSKIERKHGAGESLWHRVQGGADPGAPGLDAWPVPAGREWLETVNRAETEAELTALRRSVTRGAPFGDTAWQERTANRLGLESTLRPRGLRSKKEER